MGDDVWEGQWVATREIKKVNIATDRQAHTTTVDIIKVGLTLTHTNYNTLYLCMNTKC